MRVAVLGAAGLMGAAIHAALAAAPEVSDLAALDLRSGPGVVAVDASDRTGLAIALEGVDVLVNAASHRVNVAAMDAALTASCGYLDLGGLYHATAPQLALDGAFAAAGLLALVGCGAGPGRTNLLAAAAAQGLARVEAVRCASAGHDPVAPPAGTVALPYALDTLLSELREPPVVLREGVPVALAPLADGGAVAFPAPVGERATLFTLHSEAASLGASLGAASVDFRLALSPPVEAALRAHVRDGAPLPAVVPPSDQTVSAQLSAVVGVRPDGVRVRRTAASITHPHGGYGGGVLATAAVVPALITLLAAGRLGDGFAPLTGVLPLERAVTLDELRPALEARGSTFPTTQEEVLP